jgi:predicted O-methyltransferase YrrM
MNLSKSDIDRVDFGPLETMFPGIAIGWDYLRNVPGREHYKLLAHLSTKFNGRDIFDIGTLNGASAVALSHNPKNTVYSFDIQCRDVLPKIDSVQYIIADLWNDATRSVWQEKLLGGAFIFLDIDPHEGTREFEFYLWLKRMGYKGFVICDDILHFADMRTNFWEKIPSDEKVDVTHLGHWSGTGIIHFGDLNVIQRTCINGDLRNGVLGPT